MLPIKLEIHNFLAYRAPDPVRFDGIHLACLTGSNGAGKSSLLDAITWALWGRARAKRDEDLIHLGQNDMSVQLDFEQEGTIYRVWRQRTRKSGSSGTLELFSIGADGELIALTEQNMRATQIKINRLLRLDHETFVHSAFLQQGRADAFTTKTPQERKKPDLINGSRRARIAKGCGRPVNEVNQLLEQFKGMQKMMKKAAGGGFPGMPGMGPNGLTCTQTKGPMPEVCNGIDDDCNGVVDDNPRDVGGACGDACPGMDLRNCVGQCKPGMAICTNGARQCSGVAMLRPARPCAGSAGRPARTRSRGPCGSGS